MPVQRLKMLAGVSWVFLMLAAAAAPGKDKKDTGKKKESAPPAGDEEVGKTEEAGETEKEAAETESESAGLEGTKAHEEAVAAYKEGNFEKALELFLKAYETQPNPVTVFNIARCYEKTGKIAEAYTYYKKYIETGEEAKAPEAKEAVAKIAGMPGKITVTTSPPDASVAIDGIEAGQGPTVEKEVDPGMHTVTVGREGYETVEREVEVSFAAEAGVEVTLLESPKKERQSAVPLTIGLAVGASASTSRVVSSYIDADLGLAWRIREFSVGLGIDNKFFTDSYLLTLYPMGGFRLRLKGGLALGFGVGFGAVVFYSSERAENGDGDVLVKHGVMWDLAPHAEVKLLYRVGPVDLQLVPVCIDVLVGAGNIEPAPLAQFMFLFGVAYDL
jgi:tetratricopeptide (TPR) repeat protein